MSQAVTPTYNPPSDGAAKREFVALFRQPAFLIVFTIMLLSAVGLNAAIKALGLHFQKQAVPLRITLDRLPRQFGPWIAVSRVDAPLSAEIQHELGTKDYLTRDFIDTRKVSGFRQDEWDKMTDQQRQLIAARLRSNPATATAWIQLHMAYYTGLVDTVAHVPERCYVGSGFDPVDPQVVDLNVFRDQPGRSPILKAKYSAFTDRSSDSLRPQTSNVAYLFQVNGSYEYDSIGGVRLRLQNITERYGYYCKIELMTLTGPSTEKATSTMADFLSFAMPSIERSLPDWKQVTGQPALLNTPREGY